MVQPSGHTNRATLIERPYIIRHYVDPYHNLYRKNFNLHTFQESFYADTVCICPGGTRDDGAIFRYPKLSLHYEYYVKYKQDVQVCQQCNKLELLHLHKCKSCDSLFYHLFIHKSYTWAKPTCWHCLQEKNYDSEAISPPEYLLQPKARILTMSDRIANLKALLME